MTKGRINDNSRKGFEVETTRALFDLGTDWILDGRQSVLLRRKIIGITTYTKPSNSNSDAPFWLSAAALEASPNTVIMTYQTRRKHRYRSAGGVQISDLQYGLCSPNWTRTKRRCIGEWGRWQSCPLRRVVDHQEIPNMHSKKVTVQ